MRSSATGFYREDAARLMLEAARAGQPAPLAAEPAPYIPAVLLDEPQRPPLSPDPATNQNLLLAERIIAEDDDDDEPYERRGLSIGRLIARILLAPFYLVLLAGSVGVLALFARALLLP